MENYELKLAYLYPRKMNIYGDSGNVLTLTKRCEWRNIDLILDEINTGDDFSRHDIYFIGGGQDINQKIVADDLIKHKDFMLSEAENDAVILGINGGYQLLGNSYLPKNADKIEGLGILNAYSIEGDKRFTGNVTAKIDFLDKNTLVGFENHSGKTYLEEGVKPLAEIIIGNGNNGEDKTEGARYKNVFGTYLHGPLLPKNPHFADYLIELTLKRKYGDSTDLIELDDTFELKAHENLLNKKY